jgi:hypothetical protein
MAQQTTRKKSAYIPFGFAIQTLINRFMKYYTQVVGSEAASV